MTVFLADEQTHPVDGDALVDLAERVLRAERFPAEAEVSILLVDDETMSAQHATHMGEEGSTDVLSFPLEHLTPGAPPSRPRDGEPPLVIGDILISPAYVSRQARDLGIAEWDEMALMVVHGLLHLLGYDHEEDEEAERMEGRERELLAEVGVVRR